MGNELLIEFILRHVEDEWDRLAKEICSIPRDEFRWQPMRGFHSIGWHARHAIDWRYGLVHVLICKKKCEEQLSCLGWEHDPLVQSISSTQGWFEPAGAAKETLTYLEKVRSVTSGDIRALDPSDYWVPVKFPWRSNTVLDEIFQDIRHSSLHRGHIRQIRKAYLHRSENVTGRCWQGALSDRSIQLYEQHLDIGVFQDVDDRQ